MWEEHTNTFQGLDVHTFAQKRAGLIIFFLFIYFFLNLSIYNVFLGFLTNKKYYKKARNQDFTYMYLKKKFEVTGS